MLPTLTARDSHDIDVFSTIVENNQLASIAFSVAADRRPFHPAVCGARYLGKDGANRTRELCSLAEA